MPHYAPDATWARSGLDPPVTLLIVLSGAMFYASMG
jgi:hypothetical protein